METVTDFRVDSNSNETEKRPPFNCIEEAVTSRESDANVAENLDSNRLWNCQKSQNQREENFNFSLQKLFEEPQKLQEFPAFFVTDLQNLETEEEKIPAETFLKKNVLNSEKNRKKWTNSGVLVEKQPRSNPKFYPPSNLPKLGTQFRISSQTQIQNKNSDFSKKSFIQKRFKEDSSLTSEEQSLDSNALRFPQDDFCKTVTVESFNMDKERDESFFEDKERDEFFANLQNNNTYAKLDLAEIIQIEQADCADDYTTLKRLVKQATDSFPSVSKTIESKKTEQIGNAHQCIRQYLKDHKMDRTAQQLSQEWWLHHNERCQDYPHDLMPYSAAKQYLDLAQSHQLLLEEYKTVEKSEKKKSKMLNQCHLNLRFLTLNFKRYVAKNAKLQQDLEQVKKHIPANCSAILFQKSNLDQRFEGTRRLNRNLHAKLKTRRIQVEKLSQKLKNEQNFLKNKKSRKKNPNDSSFPEFHGLNPLGFMSGKNPVQLLKSTGMSIQQKSHAHFRAINDISISPYRPLAITTGADGCWKSWDLKSVGKPLFEGKGHNGSILRTEFHPSGCFFATAGMDHLVNFWNTDDGSKRLAIRHLNPVSALSFHSSGDFMLTGCNNGTLSLWDLNSQRCLSHLHRLNKIGQIHNGAISDCQIISFSNLCVTASEDGNVHLWDLRMESNHVIVEQSQPIRNAKVALNGHIFGTSSKFDSEVKLWDLRKLGRLVSVANYLPNFICDFNFDSSCHLLAMALSNGQVNFWDFKTGTSIVYPAHNSTTTVVTWDIWSEYMLSGDEEGYLFLWN